jgi:alpha-L-fucosidase
MRNFVWITLFVGILFNLNGCKNQAKKVEYEPAFESLEQVNPVPEWFKDAKFGIYFHWGVYSVPAYDNEWYPRNMYDNGLPANTHHLNTFGPLDEYPYHKFITGTTDKNGNFYQFAPKLKSDGGNFDPAEWAQLFADAGAKYAGPVAEHHDGFSMWASKINPWNAKEMGPKMDLVDLLTSEIRKRDMKIILSMHHAYNITGFFDKVPESSDSNLQMLYGQMGKEKNEAVWLEKHKEIIDNYKPDIIWQDFNLGAISQPVLLQFLAYYYNQANIWDKEVVATYKDGLNTKCAVLDFERGGPTDLTENYWLTDDALSSSSWCYTEGIGYYSKKQVLHGFFDRVSKNGNLLLNISPKADGTIPQEQKDILLAMGDWLKKYGEAIYYTRAWEKYGEGPTKMGAAHSVFETPKEGTPLDVRYTRSKDNNTLYAIILGWEQGQKEVTLTSLSSDRIDLKTLKKVELLNGAAGQYLPLTFKHEVTGLTVSLPEKSFDDLAYVLKLSFSGTIPALNKFVDLNDIPYYYLTPEGKPSPVIGSNGKLSSDRKNHAQQWKLKKVENGVYTILNRENESMALSANGEDVKIEEANGAKYQQWKIDASFEEMLKISNFEFIDTYLTIENDQLVLTQKGNPTVGWKFLEVCETKQTPFKPHTIPGTIEAEDFDIGCPGDTYYDKNENNAGAQYRPNEGVDIEVCAAGGYNTGWANSGEWMAYTVEVKKSGSYKLSVYVATVSDHGQIHIEFDGVNKTGAIAVPNTGGYQTWKPVSTSIQLEKGTYVMKLVLDEANSGLNLDKLIFEVDK